MLMPVESNIVLAWPHARREWLQGLFWGECRYSCRTRAGCVRGRYLTRARRAPGTALNPPETSQQSWEYGQEHPRKDGGWG
jgi:hypothetical protein